MITPDSANTHKKHLLLGCTRQDILIVFATVIICLILAEIRRSVLGLTHWLPPDLTQQLGAEYDTIAQAIRSGRGFSDVFHEHTGPTAWMPPILAYLTAGLYWLTGDNRDMVVKIIVSVNSLVMVFSGVIILSEARRLKISWIGHPLFICMFLADFTELFQRTHDTWLILLMLNITYVGLAWYSDYWQTTCRQLCWGVIGGVCILSSPVAGGAWALATLFCWYQRPDESSLSASVSFIKRNKPLFFAAIACFCVFTPWIIRTYIVLDTWTPIKSNAGYELWQSQVLDDDGLLDKTSAWQHPWGSENPQRTRYIKVGEKQFTKELKALATQSIKANPVDFFSRVAKRWVAATLYYQPLLPEHKVYKKTMLFKRLFFPLPFLCLCFLWLTKRATMKKNVIIASTIYAFYLLPYILISYYERYAAPLIVVKTILILYAFHILFQYFQSNCKSKQPSSQMQ